MKLFVSLLSITSSILLISSCGKSHKYDKSVKELDSLKIVVQQSVSHFKQLDSVACYNAYNKQYTYAKFIEINLKDTVSRAVADDLQLFHSLGKSMVNYLAMRPNWQNEAALSMLQITNLTHDLKNGSVEDEEAVEFINEEKKEAEKIIKELNENTEIMHELMQQFSQTITTAEDVTKRINNGVLPQLVNPTIRAQQEMD